MSAVKQNAPRSTVSVQSDGHVVVLRNGSYPEVDTTTERGLTTTRLTSEWHQQNPLVLSGPIVVTMTAQWVSTERETRSEAVVDAAREVAEADREAWKDRRNGRMTLVALTRLDRAQEALVRALKALDAPAA